MQCTQLCRPGRTCFLLLLLVWCGLAAAADRLHLTLAEPPASTGHAADRTFADILPMATTPWVHIRVERGDTLSGLFGDVGLAASQWQAILALGDTVDALRHLHPGDTFRLRKTPDGRLAALHFPLNSTETLVVRRTADGLTAQIARLNATTRRILVKGVVGTSLPASLRRTGIPEPIATTLTRIFEGRRNLTTTMHTGDRFSIIYAAQFVRGSRVHVGPVIAASIRTDGATYRAFRQVNADGEAHYYDSRGRPLQPGIKRTPLNYTHVSSPFDPNRVHPVLGVVRPHTGVDLAAPAGTTVHAAAGGTVTFVGWLSGYGRIIKIDHAGGYATRYAHLAGFAAGLDEGDHVDKGQPIGYVGASGVVTGPHLHYEILKHGIPHAPLTMPLPDAKPLSGTLLTAFTSRIQPLIARLRGADASPRTMLAAANGFRANPACAQSGTINAVLALAPGQVEPSALSRVFCTIGG